ncbi:MAG: hypothetical protein OEV59_02915 [Deltaproteobacteria bacterium]|nr:hypothetical protein [Deltaproteobacteria bacterium]
MTRFKLTYRHLAAKALCAVAALIIALCCPAMSEGATPAGVTINNTALVTYNVGGVWATINATIGFKVQEVIQPTITWQNSPAVYVAPSQTNAIATFTITNSGNGWDDYTVVVNNSVGGDNFDPILSAIYVDTNSNGFYDVGVDTLLSGDPGLNAGASVTLFVLSNIPAGATGTGTSRITITSKTGTGAPGTVLASAGDGGTDAVIGATSGIASVDALYSVSAATVNIAKTSTVLDVYGGSNAITGSTVTYTLTVTVAGAGTANNVVITDAIPTNTTYKTGTITLDGAPISDTPANDAGDYNSTAPGAITINLGSMTAAVTKVITFKVTID